MRPLLAIAPLAVCLAACVGDLGATGDSEGGGVATPTTSGSTGAADGTGAGGDGSFGGGGSAGEGGTTSMGTGGTAGGGGDSTGGGGVGGSGDGGAGGSVVMGCPASGPVSLTDWTSSPWVAPTSGTAQQAYILSQETWLHYEKLELDVDMHVVQPETPYNCFLELRNKGASNNGPYPWRYLAVCTKNVNPKRLVFVLFGAQDWYLTTPFALQANTDYHVHVDLDAKNDTASLSMFDGATTTTITGGPLPSSIVPQGQGLQLLVGFDVNHPDYPTIKPPWGWTFSNLDVQLTAGGPYGSNHPPCP